MKFVDDMTILEAIDIKEKITKDPNPNPVQPTTYHARTGHYLPPAVSKVHSELVRIQEFSADNLMMVNVNKTKLMIFNPSKTVDIHPVIKMNDTQLEIVEKMKVLGVIITSDLKWH